MYKVEVRAGVAAKEISTTKKKASTFYRDKKKMTSELSRN